MNQVEKALEIIKADLKINNNFLTEKCNFYSCFHNTSHIEIQFKIMLYSNLMKIHLINDNTQEAEACLTTILDAFNFKNVYEIPSFIINSMIYLNLLKGNNHIVLNLLKFRRVNSNNLNPIPNSMTNPEKNKKS